MPIPMVRRSPCSPARSPTPTDSTSRTSSSCRAVRGLRRRGRPARRTRLDRPGAAGLPGAVARPARHRTLDPGRRRFPVTIPQPGRVPHPLPRRLDRARRRVDSPGTGRRPVERARPELRRASPSMTYLSFAPEGLREVFITGGLAPIGPLGRRHLRGDLRAPPNRTAATSPAIPTTGLGFATSTIDWPTRKWCCRGGDLLTGRRFKQLGLWLGDSAGFELLHHVVELPLDRVRFCTDVERRSRASSAIRSMRRSTSRRMPMAWQHAGRPIGCSPTTSADSDTFTAEHIFPWMFEDYGALRSARRRRGDPGRARMAPHVRRRRNSAANEVPVAASIYTDDLYVERTFAEETAAASGACDRGSPTSSHTTACAPMATGSSAT